MKKSLFSKFTNKQQTISIKEAGKKPIKYKLFKLSQLKNINKEAYNHFYDICEPESYIPYTLAYKANTVGTIDDLIDKAFIELGVKAGEQIIILMDFSK